MRVTEVTLLALLVLSATGADVDGDRDDGDDGEGAEEEAWEQQMNSLKSEIMSLSPQQVRARFGEIRPKREPPPRQSKIDHFVVLYMENHAADQIFGCMGLPGFDGIPPEGHKVPHDPDNPALGSVNISCGTADYVCKKGPTYDKYTGKFRAADMIHSGRYPYGGPGAQDDKYSYVHGLEAGDDATAARMYAPEQLPIKWALAKAFGVFNKLFTAVPGPSNPNHLFTQSGTSCGMKDNKLYDDCGGPTKTFPQMTIYDNLRMHNVSFAMYMNSTCGLDGHPACHGEDPITTDSPSAINTPDVAMEGVARHQDRFMSQTIFYERAANGTLPSFMWLHPPIQACDHPCNDVAKGERLLKDVYEALRASPKWNKTLLFVGYDDAGGYYDHVVPPFEGVPADNAPCHLQDHCGAEPPFDFRRLGLRTAGMLISPLVGEGAVFQEPRGPKPTSQFELTSVASTVKTLFNLTSFLTERDAWAGSFEELLLDAPRADLGPLHLPEAPPAASPWDPPPDMHARTPKSTAAHARALDAIAGPGHCSAWDGASVEEACPGHVRANLKQKRNIRLLSALTKTPVPDVDSMTQPQADRVWASQFSLWMEQQRRLAAEEPIDW